MEPVLLSFCDMLWLSTDTFDFSSLDSGKMGNVIYLAAMKWISGEFLVCVSPINIHSKVNSWDTGLDIGLAC